jgi:hypothetical protein
MCPNQTHNQTQNLYLWLGISIILNIILLDCAFNLMFNHEQWAKGWAYFQGLFLYIVWAFSYKEAFDYSKAFGYGCVTLVNFFFQFSTIRILG